MLYALATIGKNRHIIYYDLDKYILVQIVIDIGKRPLINTKHVVEWFAEIGSGEKS